MVHLYLTNECFTTQEIPIKRKSTQSSDRVPLVRAEATPVDPQPMSLIPPVSTRVPVRWTPVVVSASFDGTSILN